MSDKPSSNSSSNSSNQKKSVKQSHAERVAKTMRANLKRRRAAQNKTAQN